MHFRRIKKKLRRFVWFQKSYKGKIYFEPVIQLIKRNYLAQVGKSQQVYLTEKEGKQNRQSGTLLFTMLKTLDSYL